MQEAQTRARKPHPETRPGGAGASGRGRARPAPESPAALRAGSRRGQLPEVPEPEKPKPKRDARGPRRKRPNSGRKSIPRSRIDRRRSSFGVVWVRSPPSAATRRLGRPPPKALAAQASRASSAEVLIREEAEDVEQRAPGGRARPESWTPRTRRGVSARQSPSSAWEGDQGLRGGGRDKLSSRAFRRRRKECMHRGKSLFKADRLRKTVSGPSRMQGQESQKSFFATAPRRAGGKSPWPGFGFVRFSRRSSSRIVSRGSLVFFFAFALAARAVRERGGRGDGGTKSAQKKNRAYRGRARPPMVPAIASAHKVPRRAHTGSAGKTAMNLQHHHVRSDQILDALVRFLEPLEEQREPRLGQRGEGGVARAGRMRARPGTSTRRASSRSRRCVSSPGASPAAARPRRVIKRVQERRGAFCGGDDDPTFCCHRRQARRRRARATPRRTGLRRPSSHGRRRSAKRVPSAK